MQAASLFAPAEPRRPMGAMPGAYLKGWNEDINARWNADVWDNGSASGGDETCSRWRYEPSARRFTHLATGRSCATSDLRRVCS